MRRSDVTARSRTTRTGRTAPWLALTRGNVAVALITTAVTIGALGLGLRGSRTFGDDNGPRTGLQSAAQAGAQTPDPGTRSPLSPAASTSAAITPTGSPTASASPAGGPLTSAPVAGPRLTGLSARGGQGQVVLSWRLSGASPGQIRATVVGSDGSHPSLPCPATATGCTIGGLANGIEYAVTVSVVQGTRTVEKQTVRTIPYPSLLTSRRTRLWFDAADPGGLLTAGTTVRHVFDRSSSGADAVPTSGYVAPTLTTINGHNALRFGAKGGLRFPAASLPSGSTPSTVYVVAALDSSTPDDDCFAHLVAWGAPQTNSGRALLKGCGTSLSFADTFATWQEARPALGWRTGQLQIMRADFTARTLAVWMGGMSSYVWSQPSGQQMATGVATDGMLGAAAWDGGGASWQGRIGEVIVLSAVPSSTENIAIMQYLQRKWGL